MKHKMSTFLGSALVGLALTVPALGQGPAPAGPPAGFDDRGGSRQGPGGQFGPGAFGGGFSQPGGRFGAGGQFGRRGPMASGTVHAVDAAAGTVTLDTPGGSRVLHVGPEMRLMTRRSVSVSDLKTGARVTVRTGAGDLADPQIIVGDLPAGLSGQGEGPSGPDAGSGTFVTAGGAVKSLPNRKDPRLMVSLGSDAQLVLKVSATARATEFASVALTDLKVGDRVVMPGPMRRRARMADSGDFGGPQGPGRGFNFRADFGPQGGFGGGAPGRFGPQGGGRRGGPPPADDFAGPLPNPGEPDIAPPDGTGEPPAPDDAPPPNP